MAESLTLSKLETDFTEHDAAEMWTLARVLSSTSRPIDIITANLERATRSVTTTIWAGKLGTTHAATVASITLNLAPTLNGIRPWIDDIAVRRDQQGNGYSKPLMDEAESLGLQTSGFVSLTSRAERGIARAQYEKRGYALQEGTIFRKEGLRDPNTHRPASSLKLINPNVMRLDDPALYPLNSDDTSDLVRVSGQMNDDSLFSDMSRIHDSETTAGFIRRSPSTGRIVAAATVNLCPIPLGYKPWFDMAGPRERWEQDPESTLELLQAGEAWTAQHFSYLNTTFTPPVGAEGYTLRDSGLYTLTAAR